MFENCLFDSSGTAKTKKPAAFAISLLLQAMALMLAAAIPLIYAEPLPARSLMTFLIAPPSPPPPRAPAIRPVRVVVKARLQPQLILEPTAIPATVPRIVDPPSPPAITVGIISVPGSTGDAVAKNFFDNATPPPPVPSAPPQPEIIRVSEGVSLAKLVSQPKPVYPPLARQAGIQGVVRMEAIISREGAIENLTVISGHPLLIPAALDAVRQWRYQPTLLNGAPVEVITTVDVNFTLGR